MIAAEDNGSGVCDENLDEFQQGQNHSQTCVVDVTNLDLDDKNLEGDVQAKNPKQSEW